MLAAAALSTGCVGLTAATPLPPVVMAHGNGGAAQVSHATLGGTPNHGVRVDASSNPGNEFNGAGPFLQGLNSQGAAGVEITPGPRWMTIRSDNNDKFAQPDGTWLGTPGKATGVNFDGPELRGALNVVIPGIDHRETSFSPAAFAAAFQFITGRAPATTGVSREASVGAVLSFTRPRGYFGVPRDRLLFDGIDPAPGITRGVAGLSVSKIKLPAGAPRAVVAELNGERIVARYWPAADNHVVLLELH